MVDKDVSKEEKMRLFKIAADIHQCLYRDAMNGKGVDRHIFALYVACKGLGYVSIMPSSLYLILYFISQKRGVGTNGKVRFLRHSIQ